MHKIERSLTHLHVCFSLLAWTDFSTFFALASSSAAFKCATCKRDSGVPSCWQSLAACFETRFPKVGRLRSRPLHGHQKKRGHVGLRCPTSPAKFKTRKALLSHSRCFDALNYPEKYRNRVLCSECVGILHPSETQTLWPEKWFENFGWHVYDVLVAWDSSLECCIASTINSNVKASKTDLSTFFLGTSDAKASFHVHVMFWVHEIRSKSAGLHAGSASMKR
jgi:hypothetical protein